MTIKVLNAKGPLGWNPPGNQKYYYDFGTGTKIPIKENKAKTTASQNSSKVTPQPKKEKDPFLEGFNLYSDKPETSNILNSYVEKEKSIAQRRAERNKRVDDFLSGFNQARDEEIAEIREKERIFNPKPREPVFKVGQDGAVATNLPLFAEGGKLELQPANYSSSASSKEEEKPKEKSAWQKGLDYASTALTAASFIPGLDTFTNILQIPVDLLRGDFLGAGLDLVGVIPGVGEIADVAKTGRTMNAIVDGAQAAKRMNGIVDGAKAVETFGDAVDAAKSGNVLTDTVTAAKTVENAGDSIDIARGTTAFGDFPAKIHEGRQGKHLIGHNNYSSGRGTVELSNDQILDLIKKYSGTGQKLSENRERIDFGIRIGKYVSEKSGKAYDTTMATVRYSKYGVHIVPARPRGWKGE